MRQIIAGVIQLTLDATEASVASIRQVDEAKGRQIESVHVFMQGRQIDDMGGVVRRE